MAEMDHLLSTTAKLVPYPKRSANNSGLASAFHIEASPGQAQVGDLAIAIEVLSPSKSAGEVIDLIVGAAKKHHYDQMTEDLAERFESTVRSINHELSLYATGGHNAWIGKVSAVLAAVDGQEVHITQTGSAQAYLYRQGHGTCITTGLTSKEPHRPSKTFGNIASGQLKPGDRLLLATPALFHQISTDELIQAVSDHGANSAVDQLKRRLGQTESLERIAATITEITTAEAAAMQPQSGLPKEAHLGKPDNLLDGARQGLAPMTARAGGAFAAAWAWLKGFQRNHFGPRLKAATLATVAWLRKHLSTRRGRIGFSIGAIVIIVAIVWLIARGGSDKALAPLRTQYQDALAKQATAAQQLSSGDKLGAKSNYQASLDELTIILKNPKAGKLDAYMVKKPHDSDDPLSVVKLRDLVASQIDQIEGLTKVNPGQLADFSAIGNAKPTLMEQIGNQFIFADPASASLYRYDLTTAKLDVVAKNQTKLGKIVALGASPAGDGVYILTDQPSVWFYTTSNNNLTQLTVSSGSWPKGQAIASYAGNLYILAADDTALYKQSKTGAGYTAPANYAINDPNVLKNATCIAVDGNIYIGNDQGFVRVLSGVVQKSGLDFPDNLKHPRAIVSTNLGKSIITTDAKSNRIGLFTFDGTLQYDHQLQITGATTVYKAQTNSDQYLYALMDQKFVRINL